MSGNDCDGLLARHDDGDRSPDVLAHVSSCPDCRRLLEVDAAVRAWTPAAASDPAVFLRRLPLPPSAAPIRRTAWLPWAVAAAAVAVAAVAIEALRREQARPPRIVTVAAPAAIAAEPAQTGTDPAPAPPRDEPRPDPFAGFRDRLVAAAAGQDHEAFVAELRDPRARSRWIALFRSEDEVARSAALSIAESTGDRSVVPDLARAAARGTAAAIRTIGRIGGPQAVSALTPLAGSPERRQAVIEALGATGRPEAAEVLSALEAWDAEEAWRRLGPAAGASIANRLRAGDRAAAGAIRAAGWTRSTTTVPALEKLLAFPETRAAAAGALGEIGSPSAMAALARAARAAGTDAGEDPALTALRRPTGRMELERRLADARLPQADRIAAAELLGALADPEAIGALTRALDDDGVRGAAFRTLGRLRSPSAVPALRLCLSDRRLRSDAAAALAEIGSPEAIPALAAAARDRAFREDACRAIAAIGGTESVPWLLTVLGDRRLAEIAIPSLAKTGDPRAIAPLIRLLDGGSGEAALRGLEALTGERPGRSRADWIRWFRARPGGQDGGFCA